MSYEKETIIILMIGALFIGFVIGLSAQNKNIKCVQGELYEEIKDNVYAKSHLECFEQRSF